MVVDIMNSFDPNDPDEYVFSHKEENKEKPENWIAREAHRQLGNKRYVTPATKHGKLACAAFISGVLKACGAMKGNGSLSQRNLELILRSQGFFAVWLEDAEPGDVIFWNAYPGRKHGHVGIIYEVDDNPEKCFTIDNSSSKGYSVIKKLNMVRPIRCVLRKVNKKR